MNEPFESKEEFIERYESELEDPWEELEDYEELPQSEIDALEEAGRKEVMEAYDDVKQRRDEFLKERLEHDL